MDKKNYKNILAPYAELGMSSSEIAKEVGMNVKYVQKLLLRYDLPRLKVGGQYGKRNQFWKGGRTIDKDGYVLVKMNSHPNSSASGYIREHRLVMETQLGRYLLPHEVVDHINGVKDDNRVENLRLFSCNGEHLKQTLKGKCPRWTPEGLARIREGAKKKKVPQ